MPPSLTDDGARAAQQLRAERPTLPVLLLSQLVGTKHSVALAATGGFGYLLKDRVLRVDHFLDAMSGSPRVVQRSTPRSSAPC